MIGGNEAVNAQRDLNRTVWRRWSRYHRRLRVETTLSGSCIHTPARVWMHCLKLLSQSLVARDFKRQVAEIQNRIIRHCRSDQWRDMAHC